MGPQVESVRIWLSYKTPENYLVVWKKHTPTRQVWGILPWRGAEEKVVLELGGKGTKGDGREKAVEVREEDGTRKGESAEGKVGASAAAPRLTW